MQTILITGCSSGFGRETARYFVDRGWNIVATMRLRAAMCCLHPTACAFSRSMSPTRSASPTSSEMSVQSTYWSTMRAWACWASSRALRWAPSATFETNTFGAIAVTQAFLPQFRQRKAGVIVNVSSSTTLKALPMLFVYTASNAALNAFTESLALELESFGVRVRLVIPERAPETAFSRSAQDRMQERGAVVPEAYAEFVRSIFERMTGQPAGPVTNSLDVAEVIWTAVNNPSSPIRLPAGADAVALTSSNLR